MVDRCLHTAEVEVRFLFSLPKKGKETMMNVRRQQQISISFSTKEVRDLLLGAAKHQIVILVH